jgi:hypothetical protein
MPRFRELHWLFVLSAPSLPPPVAECHCLQKEGGPHFGLSEKRRVASATAKKVTAKKKAAVKRAKKLRR